MNIHAILGYRSPLKGMQSANLGQTLTADAALAQTYYDIILPLLNNYCQSEGVSAQKCSEFQLQLSQCQQTLNSGVSQNNPVTVATAVLCLKNLKDDIEDAIEAAQPPPPSPVPLPTPVPQEEGLPWWGWMLIGLGGVGVVGGIAYAASK